MGMEAALSSCLVRVRALQAESKQKEGWISALTLLPHEVLSVFKGGRETLLRWTPRELAPLPRSDDGCHADSF